jgi:SAM-dependent methyltransferase
LVATDYTVSKTNFEIWHCDTCTNRFTQSIPDIDHIGAYYQSADYISHSDTNKGLVNTIYHRVRSFTLQQKRRLVTKLTKKQKGDLLDIGAGTGAFAATMQSAGWRVTALEPDATARDNAARKYGLTLRSANDIYTLPKQQFDLITLWHVLEHVHDLHGYFKRFQELLKEDGVLVIAVPNYTSKDAAFYKQYWAAWDVPRHLYHFSPAGMRKLGEQYGFTVSSIHPMWFDAFYVSMLSETYQHGKGNLPGAFVTGLRSNTRAVSDPERCSSLIYVLRKL